MDRVDIAAYIGARYGAYLDAVSRTAADSAGNLQAPIDDALRALGFAEDELATAETITAESDEDLRVQAAYHTMAQVVRDLRATIFDVNTGGDSFRLSQIRAAAESELAELRDAVMARFGTLGVVADSSAVFATIDTNRLMERPWWGVA